MVVESHIFIGKTIGVYCEYMMEFVSKRKVCLIADAISATILINENINDIFIICQGY
jgi:hypothetical protein